jgi:hypothetical protein
LVVVISAWEREVDLPTAKRVLDGDVLVDVAAGRRLNLSAVGTAAPCVLPCYARSNTMS